MEQKRFPRIIRPAGMIFNEHYMIWLKGFHEEFHIGFFRSSVPLAVIADQTGSHQIFPCIFSATRLWNDMIYRKCYIAPAAIGALIAVAPENISS